MDNFTWVDVIKILIPIATVILAGLFAIHRVRVNSKKEELAKWREDFRHHTNGYLSVLLKLGTEIATVIENNGTPQTKDFRNTTFTNLTQKIITHFSGLHLLLDDTEIDQDLYTFVIENYQILDDALTNRNMKKLQNFDLSKYNELVRNVYKNKSI